jgi:hypothetical protein
MYDILGAEGAIFEEPGVRNSMDGIDAHRSCITVRIVIEMIFV